MACTDIHINSFGNFALFVILVLSAMAQNGRFTPSSFTFYYHYYYYCVVYSFVSPDFISFHQRTSSSGDRCDAEIPESFGMQIQYYLIYNTRTIIQRSFRVLYVAAFPVRFMYTG